MNSAVLGVRARLVASDRRIVDGAVAAALSVMAQVQLPATAHWWVRTLMLVATAALAWRRQQPLVVAATVAVAVGLMGLATNPPSVFGEYLAVMLAAYTVAERCALPKAVAGLGFLLAGIVGHDWRSPQYSGVSGFVSDSAIPVVIWLVGRAVFVQRSRADRSRELLRQLEAERQELARIAVANERIHLARELHDVVTHSISVVVIQAEGAQRVLGTDHDQVADALRVISSAGRSTLTEMRRLLGLLRDESALPRAPQPGLADLSHLVSHVRSAGLTVSLATSGSPSTLDPGLDLTVYRIVQEALTNSLKYAGQATATVRLDWHADALELTIVDTGGSAPAPSPDGRGLLGMRERVSAYGGVLETGPAPSGGFRVWCRLPYSATT